MAGNWHRIGNISGRDGVGVPQGGAQGEVLVKEGGSDFATSWRKPRYEDIEGMVPASALPQISNEPYVIDSQAAMLNLPAVPGRMAIRTDQGKTYILSELPASTLSNWIELTTTSDVQSVNGKTGNVTVTKADVGLDKVNNTADADKPQATTSTPGLMPSADKTKLNNATAAATASRMVIRDANARASFRQVNLSDMPSSNGHAATKAYVDDEVNRLIAGRTPLSGSSMATNWDNLGGTSQAAVVEGFPTGAPAGAATPAWGMGGVVIRTATSHFVKSPVWEMKHEALGLNYRKQTVTLLSCDPDYMVGFSWERHYHPGTSRWTSWECVGGDTGNIEAKSSLGGGTLDRKTVFVHQAGALYNQNYLPHIRRVANTVYLSGAASPRDADDVSALPTNDGITIGYFRTDSVVPIRHIWIADSHVTQGMNPEGAGVMQGSSKNRWFLNISDYTSAEGMVRFRAGRYGPDVPNSINTWLPFSTSWTAPRVVTWTSSWVSGE